MSLAPIALFVYNRPEHTHKTLLALSDNDLAKQSQLFVFCDGPKADASAATLKAIEEVRRIVKSQKWCQKVNVIESRENKGLADAIVTGVTNIVNEYGKIIVLEDDIVTAKGFLSYMNAALNCYENEEKVMHIGSYLPYTNSIKGLSETFFLRFMSCWGWATWKRAWDEANWDTVYLYNQIEAPEVRYDFNLDGVLNFHEQLEHNLEGRITTWAIKWYTSIFLNKALCLYPNKSLSKNIGLDGSGENCQDEKYAVAFDDNNEVRVAPKKVRESTKGKQYLKRYYLYGEDSSLKKRLSVNYLKYRFRLIKFMGKV